MAAVPLAYRPDAATVSVSVSPLEAILARLPAITSAPWATVIVDTRFAHEAPTDAAILDSERPCADFSSSLLVSVSVAALVVALVPMSMDPSECIFTPGRMSTCAFAVACEYPMLIKALLAIELESEPALAPIPVVSAE